MRSDLPVWETSENGKSNGDGGIEMSTRNMTESVDHHQHYQTPCGCYSWECH